MNEEQAREIAIQILDEFEELLAAKGIKIPSDDREGREEEACLYGTENYEMEDAVVGILVEEVGGDGCCCGCGMANQEFTMGTIMARGDTGTRHPRQRRR